MLQGLLDIDAALPFTPPVLSGLVGWWDASVFSSLTLAGSSAQGIADLSGAGNNLAATPGFPGNLPTYDATGFNSRPALVYLTTGALGLSPFPFGTGSTMTCFTVGQFASSSLSFARFMSYAGGGAALDFDNISSFFMGRSALTTSVTIGRNSNFRVSAIAAGYDTPRRIISTIDAAGTQTIYVDGTAGATTYSGGAFGNNGVFAIGNTGYGGASGQGGIHGAIAECGLLTSALNPTNVTRLDTYLKNKWGL